MNTFSPPFVIPALAIDFEFYLNFSQNQRRPECACCAELYDCIDAPTKVFRFRIFQAYHLSIATKLLVTDRTVQYYNSLSQKNKKQKNK